MPVTIPVALHARERRSEERIAAAMPVRTQAGEGTTQDLSASGLAFTSERAYEPGARVEVVIDYLLDGHNYPYACEVEVVRVEPAPGGGYTIGARLAPQSRLPELAVPPEGQRPPLRPVD